MTSINQLPPEIIFEVVYRLDIRDLAAFAATTQRHYTYANPHLYQLGVKISDYTFYSSARAGEPGTLKKLIDAGVDVNKPWFSHLPKLTLEAFFLYRQISWGGSSPEVARSFLDKRRLEQEARRYEPCADIYDPFHKLNSVNYDDCSVASSDRDTGMEDECQEVLLDYLGDEDFELLMSGSIDTNRPARRTSEYHWTALHIAAAYGNDKAVDLLISSGADLDAGCRGLCECGQVVVGIWKDNDHESQIPLWTPLHIAICHGHVSTAQLLLSRGASCVLEVTQVDQLDTDTAPSSGSEGPELDIFTHTAQGPENNVSQSTALHLASHLGLMDLVRTIMEEGYQREVDIQDSLGQTPLAYAYLTGKFTEVVPYLLSKGAKINVDLGWGTTLLLHACWYARYQDAIKLIDLGAKVDCILKPLYFTPLHVCCRISPDPSSQSRQWRSEVEDNRYEAIEKLIAAGAPVEARSNRGQTPLVYAAQNSLLPVAQSLIAAGADASSCDDAGRTVLMTACLQNYNNLGEAKEIVNLLIDEGADVNQREKGGPTLLHLLCSQLGYNPCRTLAVEVLLSRGAQLGLRDSFGHLAIHEAFINRNWPAWRLLEKEANEIATEEDFIGMYSHILKPNSVYHASLDSLLQGTGRLLLDRPETLHEAVMSHGSAIVSHLLREGASTAFVSETGDNVLHEACRTWRDKLPNIIRKLVGAGIDADAPNSSGETPLSIYMTRAVPREGTTMDSYGRRDYSTVVMAFLERGADPHKIVVRNPDCDKGGWSWWERPLDFAITWCQEYDAKVALLRYPLEGDLSGFSYLHRACSFERKPPDPKFVRLLVEEGLDANGKSRSGETPLFAMLHSFKPVTPWRSDYHVYPENQRDDLLYDVLDHVDTLLVCISILEDYGALWNSRNERARDGRWTPAEELARLLAYDGGGATSRAKLESLEARLVQKNWDPDRVGDDFFPFRARRPKRPSRHYPTTSRTEGNL